MEAMASLTTSIAFLTLSSGIDADMVTELRRMPKKMHFLEGRPSLKNLTMFHGRPKREPNRRIRSRKRMRSVSVAAQRK
jgi:hypothetical protein